MAKQLNSYQVNLQFTADAKQAQQQLQNLQSQLDAITKGSLNASIGTGISEEITKSTIAVQNLKNSLQEATNVNTGKLDLSKFNASLKASGMSLEKYRDILKTLGPEGNKAFSTLASSIAQAEMPLKRSNALISELWTTLKNTARWQISSSILHGFIGSVQSAYYYAQDLNESLNNIRIVTGQNTEQMAKFAKQANATAKALSTTTTKYTDAALIYYQQGLSDEEVKERTDITVKMANVARESAETVSDQMTAVWNNFYNGSQSLEHYADAMVRLGADTASSTDEIAGGLEKFAAVANTIGLSFDNAAAALATITATTRQSEDVVGTALKTIFARIQGLKLGETLEDGTTLNQYSQALEKVGINIKDSNDELKDMDNIIEEMGNKWGAIDKDQQVALAQQVAGVRQYTQLIALMDNFDYYKENLERAQSADGSLQKQADIYAESWEAAGKRVKAAMETIYSSLLSDEFFIDLTDGVGSFLEILNSIIKSLGGVKGLLLGITSIVLTKMQPQITKGLSNIKYNIDQMTGKETQSVANTKKTANQMLINSADVNSIYGKNANKAYQEQANLQNEYIRIADKLTEVQQKEAASYLDIQKNLVKNIELKSQELELSEKEANDATIKTKQGFWFGKYTDDRVSNPKDRKQINRLTEALGKQSRATAEIESYKNVLGTKNNPPTLEELELLKKRINECNISAEKFELAFGKRGAKAFREFEQALKNNDADQVGGSLQVLNDLMEDGNYIYENTRDTILKYAESLGATGDQLDQLDKSLDNIIEKNRKVGKTEQDLSNKHVILKNFTKQVEEVFKELSVQTMSASQSFVAFAGALSSVGMLVTQIQGIIETFNDDTVDTKDKIISITTSLGFMIPMLSSVINSLKDSRFFLGSLGAQMGVAANGAGLLGKSLGEVSIAGTQTAISLGSVLTGLSGLLAAVVIVGTVILAIKGVIDYVNQASIALEDATKNAEKASDAFNEVKTSFDSLKSDIENYSSMKDSLETLTEGTKEWNEALQKNNEQVSQMLKNYPELAKYFDKKSNGQYYFTDTEAVEKIYDNKVKNAQNTVNMANVAKANANYNNERIASLRDASSFDTYNSSNFMKKIGNSTIAGSGMAAILMGILGGSAAGIGAGPIGALAGGLAGLTAVIIDNQKSAEESQQAMILLQEAYEESGTLVFSSQEEFIKALKGVKNDTIEALWKNVDTIQKQIVALDNNSTQLKNLLEIASSGYNENNEDYNKLTDEEKALADAVIAERASKDITNQTQAYVNARSTGAMLLQGNEQQQKQYLQAVYGADSENYQIKQGWFGKYTIQKRDLNGTWTDFKSGKANELGADYATYLLNQFTSEDSDTINKLTQVGNQIKSKNSKEDLSGKILQLQKDIIDGVGVSLASFDEDVVENLKNNLSQIPDEYKSQIEAAIKDYEKNSSDYAIQRLAEKAETAKSNAEGVGGVLTSLNNGDDLSTEQIAFIDTLKQKYAELNEIKDQGSHEYLTLLREIQEQEETNYLQALEDSRDSLFKQASDLSKEIKNKESALNDPTLNKNKKTELEIELQAKTDKFNEVMDKIQNTDYSIQVAIDADLKSDVDQAFGLADEFEKLQSYISDGLTISIEKAQQIIADGYGAMLTNAKETADGQIKLNQQARDSFIDDKQAELNADKDAKIKQLELEREMLVTKQQATEKAIEILQNGLEATTVTAKAEALVNAGLESQKADQAIQTEEIKSNAADAGNKEIAQDTENLVNDLGLMYADNAKNLGNSFDDATTNAETSASAQISAWNQAQRAVVEYGKKVREAPKTTGDISYNEIKFASSGKKSKTTKSKTTNSDYTYSESTIDETVQSVIDAATRGPNGSGTKSFLDTAIEKAIAEQKQKLESVNAQIGSIDAGIAALKSADIYLDRLQKNLGKTSSEVKKLAERYHEITREIQYQEKLLDKLSKTKDRVYGKARIDNINQEIEANKKLVDLQTQLYDLVLANVLVDQQEVQKQFGGQAIFNKETLEIDNYTALYNKATTDKQREALEQYEETLDKLKEQEEVLIDLKNTIQELHYEKLTYEVEVKIQLDENDTKKLEYYFDKLSDNIYKAAEALGYLQGKFDPVISQLGTYENFYGQLNNAYANGEISQENYIEGLQDVYDNTLDNLNALQDLDKEMLEYYGNTINLANDELSKYTDHMEHLTSVLDHYRSIITLLGKDKDYDKVLSILNGTAQTKKNNFDVSKQWYESLKRERDAAAAALANSTDEAEREVLQKNYDAILAAFDEAEEDMLSKAEEYGEALKEILTTKMEQAADEMNKQLSTTKVSINGNNFNISGWDALNDALDRMSSYQDEYLTKTNQIYEMNKLLNNVNQAIDKTNNQAAKNRYQQFTKEIEQLRDKDKLSQLELEIAQAKYKVFEAQIALEEAQNAKSTVRLQRDNEGNFGYVYTADQEKVNDAQQALADAENDLYNIRLNATNKYGQQKLQYEKELAEKLAELDQKAAEDAVYRETTYQQERALVIQQYTDLITTAGNLYAKAQEEDSRVVQDAWVNSFDIIKDNSNSWKDTITENTNIINDTFKEWQDSMDEITKIVGDDLKDTQQKVKDVTDESNKLYQEVSNRVIPALEGELSSVRSATEAWAQHRQQLLDTIRAYEELLDAIQATLRAQSGFGSGSSNSSTRVDWSEKMGQVEYGSDKYNEYYQNREDVIRGGYDVEAATTARVDAFYRKGLALPISYNGKTYSHFTDIPDNVWKQLVGFRSGGYTGTWNDDGKLAFLHQKELVLNADDTENMLASIQLVRQIAKQLDFNSQQISTLSSSGFTVNSQDGTLEQNVRIEASFPNATDRYEIQEAFNTLVNVASQYANRK